MDKLKALPIWVVWEKQEVKTAGSDKQKNKRYTKIPHQLNGQGASSTDPTHWTTFDKAQKAAEFFDGVGFTISKNFPLLCIDLDHVLDSEGKLIRDDYKLLIEAANSYTEVSPGKDGLHIILELEEHFPLIAKKKVNADDGTAFECYTDGRYFTFTGSSYGEEKPVRKLSVEAANDLLKLAGYPWGKDVNAPETIDATTIGVDLSDEMVLEKMFKSKGGKDIEALYNGDLGEKQDHSAADAAFILHLAFWTQKNQEQMLRIWQASPLGNREKTQTRDDYTSRTITNAVSMCEKVYSPAPLIKEDATQQPELTQKIKYSTDPKGRPFLNAYNIAQIIQADMNLNQAFRFNEFSHEHETNVRTGRDFTPLQKDDIIYTMIYIQKTYTFFEKSSNAMVQEAITSESAKNLCNPPVDLIKSMKWDGVPRIETWLEETFNAPADKVTKAIASNWLKGLVNRVITPGCKFDTVLVLEGSQGIGKSTALRVLGDPWYAETTMDIDTKDFQLILTQNIIVEFSEGASLSRSASAAMKQKITDQEDNFRKPYDRTSQKYPRHCVFAMTTNENQYLKDQTGNRRWLPVALPEGKANIDWLKENKMQLYAEAYYRVYELDETTWEFPEEELKAIQSDRMEEDPWVTKIVDWYFDTLTQEERDAGVTATQAYDFGLYEGNPPQNTRPGMIQRAAGILQSELRMSRRRSTVNSTRAWRYFDSTQTEVVRQAREEDMSDREKAERSMKKSLSYDQERNLLPVEQRGF